jgi:DNA-binding PadR family transcriptional regulator
MIENEFLFLGLLAEGPKHGYEIKLQLEEDLGPNIGLQIKSIYYPLQKMESTGLIEKEIGRREGRFPEKYVYRITPKGRKKFDELIGQSLLSVERPFFQIDLAFYFLPLVDKTKAKRRLKARLTLLKKVKKELTVLQSAAKTKILSLILQHDLDLVEAEISSTQKIISQL